MSHTPHELADEFDPAELHALKQGNAHFARLADQYHEVNRAIHRIEAEIDPASDERTEQLKKERLALLDQVGAMLAAERA